MAKDAAPPAAGAFSAWERSIAFRYLRAKRKHGGVALISIISFIGIMLAVAVMIIVMSVMNGFRTELLDRILGFNGHVYVGGPGIDGPNRDAMIARLRAIPGVVQVTPVIEAQAMVSGPNQITGGLVRGLAPDDLAATKIVADNIRQGSLRGYGQGEFGGDLILVGSRLAETVGVTAGDSLTLISPNGGDTVFGSTPRSKDYIIGGIFEVGMSEYDAAYIYMPLAQSQLFFGQEGLIDVVEVNLDNPDSVDRLKPAIAEAAGPATIVTDWRDRNRSYFTALAVERNVMRLILAMIVAIAAMNIISGLVMLVKNKTRDIAILRTMGASRGSVLRIFFMSGAAIGVLGTVAGLLVGSLFCIFISPIQDFVEAITKTPVFNADTYFLSQIPADIEWLEVLIITVCALTVSFLATLPPSWRASRLDPVEALRYE
jgi:lipoprotein-releasing system permease protein